MKSPVEKLQAIQSCSQNITIASLACSTAISNVLADLLQVDPNSVDMTMLDGDLIDRRIERHTKALAAMQALTAAISVYVDLAEDLSNA